MRTGAFFFGGVEMNDASAGPPDPLDRRYSAAEMWEATERIIDLGVAAERSGFDHVWLAEHHFQYEGYEVLPNCLMIGAIIAERTERINIGSLVNIVPQWHPLRFAEDFATLHNLSKGRAILGVGRGTVPREAESLGTVIGSFDNPDKVAADRSNRAQFDEGMDVLCLALDNETFSYHGDVYDFPPPGIADRGGTVQNLTLVPRPLYPYEIWQVVTSPVTARAVPKRGWGAVWWNKHYDYVKQEWEQYAEIYEQTHDASLAPGEKRMLVLTVRIEDSTEVAIESARDGHDEFWKFLGPYGWSRGYKDAEGSPVPEGAVPTLEESFANRTWIVGSPDDVAEGISWWSDHLGGLSDLCIFPHLPGDSYDKAEEQLSRWSEEVAPNL